MFKQMIPPSEIERLSNQIVHEPQNLDFIRNSFLKFGEKPSKNNHSVFKLISILFFEPMLPSRQVASSVGLTAEELKKAYSWLRKSKFFQALITSNYHPLSLMIQYAKQLITDLIENPGYFQKILNKESISPRVLEVHVTNGKCNYMCKMCLWRVGQRKPRYNNEKVKKEPLSTKEWKKVISQAKKLGTEAVVFSGGGEPTLREESHIVMAHARELGLKRAVNTNGSRLLELCRSQSPLFQEYLKCNWIRISLHAAHNQTYNQIAGLPMEGNNLQRVVLGIKSLIENRQRVDSDLKIGIGFVIQESNVSEVLKAVQLTKNIGVDFLNLRTDFTNITKKPGKQEMHHLLGQLRRVRTNYEKGYYDDMNIDFTDGLIALMNGWTHDFTPKLPKICRAYFHRAAIGPYGRVAICDLTSDPYYSHLRFTRGFLREKEYAQIVLEDKEKTYPGDKCSYCSPGQIALNVFFEKIINDAKIGIMPEDQFLNPAYPNRFA